MPGVLDRQNRILIEQSLQNSNGVVQRTTSYSMPVQDYYVEANTTGGTFTITLPSVAEANGRSYLIRLTAGAVGAAPNNLTISPKAKDSTRGSGNITLNRPGQYVVLQSDGQQWNRLSGMQSGQISPGIKYFHEMFNTCPLVGTKLGGPHSVTLENVLRCGSGLSLSYMGIVGQTLMPQWADPGLDIAGDQVGGDGWIFDTGVGSGNTYKFVVGTDPAFFVRCRFSIADASGWANLLIGFRKQEAKTAAYDDYNDLAGLNVLRGAIRIDTILGNAATVNTDTTNTWADAATHTFQVNVSAAGVVTYLIDGVAPTTVAAYTFTNALTLIPFIQGEQHADLSGATVITELEVGYL